jgi:hypothetical protein
MFKKIPNTLLDVLALDSKKYIPLSFIFLPKKANANICEQFPCYQE